MRRKLVAGNWKMNTTRQNGVALAKAVVEGTRSAIDTVDVLVCPPFPYLIPVLDAVHGSSVAVGAQNVYFEPPGAFTGEVAVDMLVDLGCQSVILGHSERRHVLGETDADINRKVIAARTKNLQVIFCVGELLQQRQAAETETVLDRQMHEGLKDVSSAMMPGVVIAYEPVWAIGTGQTATPVQAESAHAHLRKWLKARYTAEVANSTRILYGGSVKPNNAEILLSQPNIDGALVGGASLKPADFVPIVEAAAKVS